jgi:adenylate cyclase
MEYTAIGDTVNLAARLESATKDYGVSLLVSDATRRALTGTYPLRELDRLRVKGKGDAVAIHQVMVGPERLDVATLERFNGARLAYARRDWAAAIAGFEAVLAVYPDDGPARMLLARCGGFADAPPPLDWDGVWPPRA